MKRKPVLLTLITVVVLGVLITLPVSAQGPHHEGEGSFERGPGKQACLACIPDMTAELLEEIQSMREEHREEMEGIHEKLFEAKTAFHELLREPEPDLSAVRRAKERLDDLGTEMLIAHLEMRREIRGMLTDEQRVFFDEMQMHHPGPGGRHPMGSGPGMGPGSGMGPGPGGMMGY